MIRLRKLEEQLGLVELTVLANVAQRLVTGQMVYGSLEDKLGKGHDWIAEAQEESYDRMVYLEAYRLDQEPNE